MFRGKCVDRISFISELCIHLSVYHSLVGGDSNRGVDERGLYGDGVFYFFYSLFTEVEWKERACAL